MIAYIDSSVLMRVVLAAPNQLKEWPELRSGVSSQLLKVEGFRTLDQLWHRGKLDAARAMHFDVIGGGA